MLTHVYLHPDTGVWVSARVDGEWFSDAEAAALQAQCPAGVPDGVIVMTADSPFTGEQESGNLLLDPRFRALYAGYGMVVDADGTARKT